MNWADLTWPEIQQLAPDTPVVFPVAAIEQHGHHLPVATDSMLLGEVIRRLTISSGSQVLFARCSGWAIRIITWISRGHCQPGPEPTWT